MRAERHDRRPESRGRRFARALLALRRAFAAGTLALTLDRVDAGGAPPPQPREGPAGSRGRVSGATRPGAAGRSPALTPAPGPTRPPGAARLAEPTPAVVGRPIEVRGEVVDLECYLREGKRGEGHRSCALACLARGGSLAIVEDETGALFPLAGATPASDPGAALRDLVAQRVLATGRLYERARSRVLVIDAVRRLSE